MKNYDAVIFDLDGVITKTALAHAASWKEMFDEYLKSREQRDGESFKEFTHEKDYLPFVDGKPRYKGVQSFLESRGIDIPYGDPADAPDMETACGLGNKKNIMFKNILAEKGAEVFDPAVALIKDLKANGVHVGVASSSKNCQLILQKTGLEDLFETRVDGVVSAELGLKGKPEGDIFVTACKNVGCTPDRAVVVEDAVSGVQAGKNGGFAFVLGVAREGNEKELQSNGADVVVTNLENVNAQRIDQWIVDKI
ncbi:MAG: beta-phosphoglucomutase family hydrolase [Candidatus Omnitrophica bacterium]|nr:beta-phosphoglucomutase family hydrolase [Candidatus Omnitrophota bacterium]